MDISQVLQHMMFQEHQVHQEVIMIIVKFRQEGQIIQVLHHHQELQVIILLLLVRQEIVRLTLVEILAQEDLDKFQNKFSKSTKFLVLFLLQLILIHTFAP